MEAAEEGVFLNIDRFCVWILAFTLFTLFRYRSEGAAASSISLQEPETLPGPRYPNIFKLLSHCLQIAAESLPDLARWLLIRSLGPEGEGQLAC